MDSNLTAHWVNFFTAAGIPSDVGATYALTFTENRIQNDMLLDLNKEYLRDMGITRMGDVIAILRHAKLVHENAARDRVLSSASNNTKVPVAAVTGRLTASTTSQKASSPASRILEHYTRNTAETSPVHVTSAVQKIQKRKLVDTIVDTSSDIKKARLIRFSSPTPVKIEGPVLNKQTVFARLGNTDLAPKTNIVSKPVFARLGAKSEAELAIANAIPLQRDALKYEGILKSTPAAKKLVTITMSKNNVRRIAMGTMRADEPPVSVKEKLAVPKTKSVKFSNTVEYKEIDRVKLPEVKMPPKYTPVFNKPERRLAMPDIVKPDTAGIKARLGTKTINNLTVTRSVQF